MKMSYAISAAIAVTLVGSGFLVAGLAGSQARRDLTLVTPGIHDCTTAPNPVLDASGATFTIVGMCERILINGGPNRITIEASKVVEINGAGNVIEIDAVDKARLNGPDNAFSYKRAVTGKTSDVVAVADGNSIVQVN